MSGKAITSKYKHYTAIEKKYFLQILNEYKHIIENKKNDGATLKEKENAWKLIYEKYNDSTLVIEERDETQLKKLWRNLKQGQREALTKERQSRFKTGGGPPDEIIHTDPDISNIAPNLMMSAPMLFSSNMSEKEVQDKRDLLVKNVTLSCPISSFDTQSEDPDDPHPILVERHVSEELCVPTENVSENVIIEIDETCRHVLTERRIQNNLKNSRKRKRTDEGLLKIERINKKLEEEMKIAKLKIEYEKAFAEIKIKHLKEINQMEKEFLKEKYRLELSNLNKQSETRHNDENCNYLLD
ncbi:myb/SANT-like DNA-binding domain-containing protein 3 [Prorops nasuta]|uniref:myb/SANT-like DNA-binding domain-containing protein 3 n=1 Tax=Prorops nasuta TaxID=863751 RepID=UPI0034CE3F5A